MSCDHICLLQFLYFTHLAQIVLSVCSRIYVAFHLSVFGLPVALPKETDFSQYQSGANSNSLWAGWNLLGVCAFYLWCIIM